MPVWGTDRSARNDSVGGNSLPLACDRTLLSRRLCVSAIPLVRPFARPDTPLLFLIQIGFFYTYCFFCLSSLSSPPTRMQSSSPACRVLVTCMCLPSFRTISQIPPGVMSFVAKVTVLPICNKS